MADPQLHRNMLRQALDMMAAGKRKIQVQTSDDTLVSLPLDLLLFYSPLLRPLLPPCTSPFLLLPCLPLAPLLALVELLTQGRTQHSATPSEVEDAASQLGINLRSIQALHHPGIQALHPGIQALHPDIQALHPDIQALPETGDTDRQAARHTVPENTAVFENTTVSENATVSVDTGEQLLVDTQEPGGASVNPDATRPAPVPEVRADTGSRKRKTVDDARGDEEARGQQSHSATPPPSKRAVLVGGEARPGIRSGGGGLVCRVQNAQCTAQGKVFPSAYDLRYHYSKHARTALLNKLTKARPYFQNAANKCYSCDVTLPSQDKLVFHIGAKHKEVDSILMEKGIPVPEEEVPAPAGSSSSSSAGSSHHSAPPARQASVAETAYEVNYELQCQVCDMYVNTLTQLNQHCTSHFFTNIQTSYGHQMSEDGKNCLICGYTARTRALLVTHLGCKHGKVNSILLEQGYKALPCPVAIKTAKDDEIQRNLMKLKKERQVQDISETEEGASSSDTTAGRKNVTFGEESIRYIPALKKKF